MPGRSARDRGLGVLQAIARGGKEQLERGAPPYFGINLQRALVPANDAEHRGETQPASGELRRVKRIEDSRLRLRAHAAAVIGDLQENVFARNQIEVHEGAREVGGIDAGEAGVEADVAALFPNGLGGVDDEIHDDLPDLRGIHLDRRQAAFEEIAEHRFFADGNLQHLRGVFHQLPEIELLDDKAPASRRVAAGLADRMRPVGSSTKIASQLISMSARYRASLARCASSACLRLVMSRWMPR